MKRPIDFQRSEITTIGLSVLIPAKARWRRTVQGTGVSNEKPRYYGESTGANGGIRKDH
jgi:hypothetical protein